MICSVLTYISVLRSNTYTWLINSVFLINVEIAKKKSCIPREIVCVHSDCCVKKHKKSQIFSRGPYYWRKVMHPFTRSYQR